MSRSVIVASVGAMRAQLPVASISFTTRKLKLRQPGVAIQSLKEQIM